MTVFDTLWTELAEPPLRENYGEPVVHTASNGTQTTLTAVFGLESSREESGRDGGRVRTRELSVVIFKSDLPAVVIKHGKITRNEEVWTIDEVDHETGTEIGLSLLRNEPAEISGPGFRES